MERFETDIGIAIELIPDSEGFIQFFRYFKDNILVASLDIDKKTETAEIREYNNSTFIKSYKLGFSNKRELIFIINNVIDMPEFIPMNLPLFARLKLFCLKIYRQFLGE